MISVPFWLMGPSVAHALLVTKAAFLLSLALLYLLGKEVYGKQVGLASVVLAASSSYMMKLATHLYIDHVQTLFMLVSLYVFIQAIERGRHGLSILAGVSLGIAFLCKELAILWGPLPLLLVLGIAKWRTWNNLRLVIAFWLGFFLPVASWWFYYYVVTGEIFLMSNAVWGVGYRILPPLAISVMAMLIAARCGYLIYTRSTERSLSGAALYGRVKSLPLSLVGGLGWLIWLVFTIAFLIMLSRATGWISSPSEIPIRFSSFVDLWYTRVVPDQPLLRYLLVVALVPVLVGAFLRKQKSDRVLIWSLLTCVPLMLTANPGRYFPSRYLLPVFWLAYLALGRLLILIISFVAKVLRRSRSKANLFVHSFQNTLLLILIVCGAWKSYTSISTEEYVSSTPSGAYNDQSVVEVGRWLSEHAPPGSNIGSTLHYLTGLYFYTGGQYEFYQFWRRSLDIEQVWPYNTQGTYLANQGDRTTFVYLNQPDVTISDPLYVQYAGEKKFRQGAYDAGLVYFSGLSQQRLVDYLQRF
jgi:4-amino-4-deoxy-L-arabinose transferase-like glycosyltransferase